MEKRAILAAMLMAGLLMVYQLLFVKPEPQPPAPAQKSEAPAASGAGTTAGGATTPGGAAPAAVPAPPPPAAKAPRPPEQTVTVQTPLYRASVGSDGGEIKAWELIYRGQKPLVV